LAQLEILQVYSGCLSIKFPYAKATSDDKKLKHVGKYRWTLIWETTDFVSESFYRALAYDSLPIVYYDGDDLAKYLPGSGAVVDLVGDGFAEKEPEKLVEYLNAQTETGWMKSMSWKRKLDQLPKEFVGLFDRTLESLVCRLCSLVP
jgi:hypothetical protein